MRKYNPFRNIFYYYRGPSARKHCEFAKQIEDNTTKALINTLENSSNGVLLSFLKELEIPAANPTVINYDLQVAEDESRPDALIAIDGINIYIESKIDCPLTKTQILSHLKLCNKGYLICIAPRERDKNPISDINSENLRFITWSRIYCFFRRQLKEVSKEQSRFVIAQFLAYLEAINMSPFTGWNKNDFEAFYNVEDDPRRQLRLRVKEKLYQYLVELKETLKKEGLFSQLYPDVGTIKQEAGHVWGVLCKAPLETKVHSSHFNFWVNSDEFGMGVLMEGKAATEKMKKRMTSGKDTISKILKKLNGFDFVIRKRVNISGGPRDYHGIDVVTIKAGKDMRMADIDYAINKVEQYDLCEIHAVKVFKRDDKALIDQSFLQKSVGFMRALKDFYDFSCGG